MVAAGEVTEILAEMREGSHDAWERLMPLIYKELRQLAARSLRHERQTTSSKPADAPATIRLTVAARDPPRGLTIRTLRCRRRLPLPGCNVAGAIITLTARGRSTSRDGHVRTNSG